MSNFDDELIAACIQSPEIFRRARRAGVTPEFFDENEFAANAFRLCQILDSIGNPFNVDAFTDLISRDPEIESRDKGAWVSRINSLSSWPIENSELQLKIIRENCRERAMTKALQNVALGLKKGVPVDELWDEVFIPAARLGAESEIDYELFNYYAEFEQRVARRLEQADAGTCKFKFVANLKPFEKYFPYGLPPATTTTVAGPTFSGKSVLLSNMAHLATHPTNGLTVLYVVSENTKALTGDRFDSMYLQRSNTGLFKEEMIGEADHEFFKNAKDDGWGDLWIVKVPPGRFDANTLRSALDEVAEKGEPADILMIDSPEHQRSVDRYREQWQEKGSVYMEIKQVSEEYDIPVCTSLQLKQGTIKRERVNNEDVAGAIEISRIVNHMIMFNVTEEDQMLNRARLIVTKNRSHPDTMDHQHLEFFFSDSLLLQPYDKVLNAHGAETVRVRKKRKAKEVEEEAVQEEDNGAIVFDEDGNPDVETEDATPEADAPSGDVMDRFKSKFRG